MYCVAKILGQIYANPPFYVLRCLVSEGDRTEPLVVKGKIAGPVGRGQVLTFKGKKVIDKEGRSSLEIDRTPINPKLLTGTSLTMWSEWADPSLQKSIELFSTLADSGANVKVINSLWREISSNPEVISQDPWFLVQKGLSYKVADSIASKLLGDFDQKDPRRVAASILWSLKEATKSGHCYLDTQTAFRDAGILTGIEDMKQIAEIMKGMMKSGSLVIEKLAHATGNAIYTPSYHKMEVEVCSYLTQRDRHQHDEGGITDEYIRGLSRYALTDDQVLAVRRGLTEPVSIVTGLPGTGKTTILNTLCKALRERKEQILLVAPTGIAAKRVSALTGLEAQTIHRAFGAGMPTDDKDKKSDYEGVKKSDENEETAPETDRHLEHWKYNPMNQRGESVLIVDEASMVDLHLLWRMMRGISASCRVVLVGDIAQLPPVGAGFSLQEMIGADVLPRIHLDTIFRQGEGSGVVAAAHAIHKGVMPMEEQDFVFEVRNTKFDILEYIVEKCKELQMEGIDFHVMSPTHHGVVGVTSLNRELRAALNANLLNQKSVRVGDDEVRVGDRIMMTKNDYELEVFNGDVGVVHFISNTSVEVIIKGVKNQLVALPMDRVSSLLRLAYATTVHKAQGQEYNTIIMPMCMDFGVNLLQRSLLYTAITRAKEKVYLVGDREAMAVSVSNISSSKMMCGLKSRLMSKSPF
jgi:exodeoxyribonuclease V alpha subunit